MSRNAVKEALAQLEAAFEDIQSTPGQMSIEEFEKRILRMAKRCGVTYSQAPGKWLDKAKKALADPAVPQEIKNLYLAEVHPPELRRALAKFDRAFHALHDYIEWAYDDLHTFVADTTKNEGVRSWVRWRVLPVAEALQTAVK